MQITNVRTVFVDPGGAKNWLFVKVETDAGIHGWGECYTQADRDLAIEAHVQQLGRYLIGRDPHQIQDILNPDICACGGILELKAIAAMAEPYFVTLSPHNYNSTTIGLAATLQLCAAIPNFLITEYFVNFTARGDAISTNPIRVEKGYIPLPASPGLGIELDEAAMASYPYREFPRRTLPQFV